jgi:hypothetical protein
MNLDNNYRLTADDFNFILQRKRKRAKNSKANEWQNVGYWQDLGQALEAYSNGVKRASLPTTLDELLQLQHAHSTQIKRIGERCVSLWGKES